MYVSAKSLSDTLEHLIQLQVAKFDHWGRSVMTGLLCELYVGRDKHLGIGGDKLITRRCVLSTNPLMVPFVSSRIGLDVHFCQKLV